MLWCWLTRASAASMSSTRWRRATARPSTRCAHTVPMLNHAAQRHQDPSRHYSPFKIVQEQIRSYARNLISNPPKRPQNPESHEQSPEWIGILPWLPCSVQGCLSNPADSAHASAQISMGARYCLWWVHGFVAEMAVGFDCAAGLGCR